MKEIYLLTDKFPRTEIYGIILQLRRAAVSIPSNIAEGYGRRSIKQYNLSFLIAYGSALELETQLIIAKMLNMTKLSDFKKSEELLIEVLKMLNVMTNKKKLVTSN